MRLLGWRRQALCLCAIFITAAAFGAVNPETPINESKYLKLKEKIQAQSEKYKSALNQVIRINLELSELSKRRKGVSDRLFSQENGARELAQEMIEIKSDLKNRRGDLLKRLRAIYLFSKKDAGQILFSSQNLKDLEKNVSALKRISKNDILLIQRYTHQLELLKQKDEKLKTRIEKLAVLQKNLINAEQDLLEKQKRKSKLVKNLRRSSKSNLSELLSLQNEEWFQDLTDTAFFEQKGKLAPPVSGVVSRNYGAFIDSEYRFRLFNKGLEWITPHRTPVKAVFDGRVAFVGALPGHQRAGRYAIIDHGDNYYSVYGGLSLVDVEIGQQLHSQQVLGKSSGLVQFEIRYFSEAINPSEWISLSSPKGQPVAQLNSSAEVTGITGENSEAVKKTSTQ